MLPGYQRQTKVYGRGVPQPIAAVTRGEAAYTHGHIFTAPSSTGYAALTKRSAPRVIQVAHQTGQQEVLRFHAYAEFLLCFEACRYRSVATVVRSSLGLIRCVRRQTPPQKVVPVACGDVCDDFRNASCAIDQLHTALFGAVRTRFRRHKVQRTDGAAKL